MSYKKGTYLSLLCFAAVGVLFYIASSALPQTGGQSIGSGYFPGMISLLLIAFCIISFVTTKRKQDEHVPFPNSRYILFTIVLCVLFAGLWQWFGAFYVVAFAVIAVMLYFYNQAGASFRKGLKSLSISFIITLFAYLVFERLLKFPL